MRTLSTHRLPSLCHDTNDQLTLANAVAYHSLSLFLQDTKDLVTAHVKHDIDVQIKSDQQLISSHGKRRKMALNTWIKSEAPLSWTADDSQTSGAYLQLITILGSNPNSSPSELQRSPDLYSHFQLATRLYKICTCQKATAPVCPNGSFFPVLPLAIARIRLSLPCLDNQAPDAPIISIFAKMLRKMKIDFVPWHKCETQNSRAYVVQPNWWMMMKATPMAEINQGLPKQPEQVNAELADYVMLSDPNAPWDLPDTLQDMGPLWNKYKLPSDWSLDAASLPASHPGDKNYYVRHTYEYMETHYDGRIWWHHLALVWGILFSKVTPYVFASKKDMQLSRGSLDEQIHMLPWETRTTKNHGGVSMPLPFVTMVSTTIFALLDSNSPLSKRAAQNKNAFGDPWTSKHGK
jgi:hypothetical protein